MQPRNAIRYLMDLLYHDFLLFASGSYTEICTVFLLCFVHFDGLKLFIAKLQCENQLRFASRSKI